MDAGGKPLLQVRRGMGNLDYLDNEDLVDFDTLIDIESSGNYLAKNPKSGALGLTQIMPEGKKGALDEWNNYHPKEKKTDADLLDPQQNMRIGHWYMYKRIPQMLKHFKKPVTTENMLHAYNGGIGKVVDGVLPAETKKYIEKYKTKTIEKELLRQLK